MNKPRIFAVHLLNDFSGSPLILRQSLEALNPYYEIRLFTATPGKEGFLSNIDGIAQESLPYRWSRFKLLTLFFFIRSQISLFFLFLKKLKKDDLVYINTLLPFGAAWAARMRGCRVIYHIHEVSVRPALLLSFLRRTANICASRLLFVSAYVRDAFPFRKPGTVIYNALPGDFLTEAGKMTVPYYREPFTVAMLCSAKAYKGIYEFAALARQMPATRFILVLNAPAKTAQAFGAEVNAPGNLQILSACKNTLAIYESADLVVNLSRPEEWIETFGMTILEAMACGRPVIVPTCGGVCELADHDQEGFRIDARNQAALIRAIQLLTNDRRRYRQMAAAARKRSAEFSPSAFRQQITSAFRNAQNPETASMIWKNQNRFHSQKTGF